MPLGERAGEGDQGCISQMPLGERAVEGDQGCICVVPTTLGIWLIFDE